MFSEHLCLLCGWFSTSTLIGMQVDTEPEAENKH